MDGLELFALCLAVASAWLWFDSLKARERAVAAIKTACRAEDLLLLDDTVAIVRVGLRRDRDGRVQIRRVYGFEYSATGDERSPGEIVMDGGDVLVISLRRPGQEVSP